LVKKTIRSDRAFSWISTLSHMLLHRVKFFFQEFRSEMIFNSAVFLFGNAG
jgi:hypothetical protein